MSTYYAGQIEATCGCAPQEAQHIESVMRDDIVHGTLDWLDNKQFRIAALQAQCLYREEQATYDAYFAGIRALFQDKGCAGDMRARATATATH